MYKVGLSRLNKKNLYFCKRSNKKIRIFSKENAIALLASFLIVLTKLECDRFSTSRDRMKRDNDQAHPPPEAQRGGTTSEVVGGQVQRLVSPPLVGCSRRRSGGQRLAINDFVLSCIIIVPDAPFLFVTTFDVERPCLLETRYRLYQKQAFAAR